MIEPIIIEFDVAAPVSHAFEIWTTQVSRWWPRPHTVSQEELRDIVFESRAGGRIYEKAADGSEHVWGEVLIWEPPRRVEYLWHIFMDPSKATTVSVSFEDAQSGSRVRLEQSGFEVFGDEAERRRDRVEGGWSDIIRHFVAYWAG